MEGLTDYVRGCPGFDWGRNNCLQFVSGWMALSGAGGLPEEWLRGYRTAPEALRRYKRLLRVDGSADIIEAVDKRLTRSDTLSPPEGGIVARRSDDVMGYSFGICHRGMCVFVGEDGAKATFPELSDIYWRLA